MFRPILYSVGIALVAGCVAKPPQVSCLQRDWYEIGRRDGSQGTTTDRVDAYSKECKGTFDAHARTVYTNGRNAGLVEFCQPDNAYQLGLMGLSYAFVCPTTMEGSFLSAYRQGQTARSLELRAKDLDARIDSLSQRVKREPAAPARDHLASKLEELQRQRQTSERELSRVRR